MIIRMIDNSQTQNSELVLELRSLHAIRKEREVPFCSSEIDSSPHTWQWDPTDHHFPHKAIQSSGHWNTTDKSSNQHDREIEPIQGNITRIWMSGYIINLEK